MYWALNPPVSLIINIVLGFDGFVNTDPLYNYSFKVGLVYPVNKTARSSTNFGVHIV